MNKADLCVICKGTKKLCGLDHCPLITKINLQNKQQKQFKEDVFGPSNDIFVGSYGYPNLSVGPMVSTFDKPTSSNKLYGLGYNQIISERTKMIRGKRKTHIKNTIEEQMKDIALSIKNVDVELKFSKKPFFDLKFSSVLEPMGASAPIKKYRLTDNPKIPKKIDSVIDENLLAVEAIDELYKSGFDNYYLTKVLSIGMLGKRQNKKFVPTRWSITATDDIIGKKLIKNVRGYKQINKITMFYNKFLYNKFVILLIPGNWEFENFESWSPESVWARGAKENIILREFEKFEGRTTYAKLQTGGYYASRLGVLEYLNRIKRQARVVAFREIGREYIIPVGVWEVRENVRNAFKNKSFKFSTISDAIELIKTKLDTPFKNYKTRSRILTQQRLSDYL